jgi:AraC-like DNA-binding protein
MNYLDIMQNSIDYIEKNLKSNISAYQLAENAGFSLFHYYRLFQHVVGIPVMQYILRRKLYNAIYEISSGEKIIDVALSYGFETHSGFFKAFKREFDCSPSLYLKKYKVVKPYKINLKQEGCIMLTDKKIKEVLSHWDLKEPMEIKSLYYGSSGTKSENSWIVNNDFIIKVSTNISGLKQHIILSKSLAHAGVETATPVPTKDNNDYFIDGQLYFFLAKRIKGECIKSSEIYEGDYKSNGRYLGESIGQLHLILQKQDKIGQFQKLKNT